MNYWVNSNSGDYIVEDGGQHRLYLLARWTSGVFQSSEIIELTQSQFESMKGFVTIKEKKLFSRLNTFNTGERYAQLTCSGFKEPNKTNLENLIKREIRRRKLDNLGI